MTERKESAADISIDVGGNQMDVTQMSVSKDIEAEEIYGAGNTMPSGYAIHNVSYSGDITVVGSNQYADNELFDEDGIPEEFTVTITHRDGDSTVFNSCIITSAGYEINDGETTETSYEFIAMSKDSDVEPN